MQGEHHFLLGHLDPDRQAQVMIVTKRHVETPFDLNDDEWAAMGPMLTSAKAYLSPFNPAGYTVGWNVGAAGGQTVMHAHLHVVARFADEPKAGLGIHGLRRG